MCKINFCKVFILLSTLLATSWCTGRLGTEMQEIEHLTLVQIPNSHSLRLKTVNSYRDVVMHLSNEEFE